MKWVEQFGRADEVKAPDSYKIRRFRLSSGSYGSSYFAKDLNGWYRSKWEANFVRWMNSKGIEAEYEPYTFNLGNTQYVPDFFVLGWNCWVEIKGRETHNDFKKVTAFISRYPRENLLVVDGYLYHQLEKVKGWEK